MKKWIALMLLAVAVIIPAGAADYFMGFGAGYGARVNYINSDSKTRMETAQSVPFSLDNLIIWPREEAALAFSLYGDPWMSHPTAGKQFFFGGDVAGLWKKDFGGMSSFMLGGGLSLEMNAGSRPAIFFVNVFADVKLLFEVMNEMSLIVDYKAGYDLASIVGGEFKRTNQMSHKITLAVAFRDIH